MKRKLFESVCILKGNFTEEEYKKAFAGVKKHLTKYDIKKIQDFGKKRLAYALGTNTDGYFISIELKATEKEILELERFYRINADILKFIVVKKDRE